MQIHRASRARAHQYLLQRIIVGHGGDRGKGKSQADPRCGAIPLALQSQANYIMLNRKPDSVQNLAALHSLVTGFGLTFAQRPKGI
jgi:hypothetical protein